MRLVLEHWEEYPHEWAAIKSIAGKVGCSEETLRGWVRRAEVDGGVRPGTSTAEAGRIKELERENRELRRASEILKAAAAISMRQCNAACSVAAGVLNVSVSRGRHTGRDRKTVRKYLAVGKVVREGAPSCLEP